MYSPAPDKAALMRIRGNSLLHIVKLPLRFLRILL